MIGQRRKTNVWKVIINLNELIYLNSIEFFYQNIQCSTLMRHVALCELPAESLTLRLINETKSIKFCDNVDLRIKVSNDMDILKLCETINELRELNLKICDNTIFLPTGETYEVKMSEDLAKKVDDLPNRLNLLSLSKTRIDLDAISIRFLDTFLEL